MSSDNKYMIIAGWSENLTILNVENQTIKKRKSNLNIGDDIFGGPAKVGLVEHPDHPKFVVLYGHKFGIRIFTFENLEELYFIRKDRRLESKHRWWHDRNLHRCKGVVRHPDPR